MPHLIHEAPFEHGEFAFWPLHLHGRGASTEIHEHKYAQVAHFFPGSKGDARYEVFAVGTDGVERRLERGPYGFQYLGAGVKHRIQLIEGDEGVVVCMFATHDPGPRRPDVLAGIEDRELGQTC